MTTSSSKAMPDMGRGSEFSLLLKLSAPAMISLFFQNLYTLVDTVFVSWVSTTALAALSLSVPVGYVALATAKGIGVGTTALMSNAMGRDRSDQARQVSRAALPLMFLVLAPLLLLVIPKVSYAVYGLLGASGDVLVQSYRYAIWMALSFPLMGYVTICEAIFMSHGNSKTPMQAMIAGNVVNICLDPLLIFVLKLGVEGAALATLCGWIVSALILHWQIGRQDVMRPGLRMDKEMPAVWKSIGSFGFVVFVAMLVSPVSLGIINRILAGYGPEAVGAWSVMSRTELMVVLPLMGLSNAVIPFMGHNLGLGNRQRIRSGMFAALKLGVSMMLVAGVLIFCFSDTILSIFGLAPRVFELARFAVRLSTLAYPLIAIEMVFHGMAQGLKHPKYSLVVNSLRLLATRVPLALLFSVYWGSKGVFVSHPAAVFVMTAVTIVLMMRLMRMVSNEISQSSFQHEAA